MLSRIFMGLSLVGAEWVLYLLLILSVISVALIIERTLFYREARRGLAEFRVKLRAAVESARLPEASAIAKARRAEGSSRATDLESEMAEALLREAPGANGTILGEIAHDAVMRARLHWERNLSVLATIGANAPFVGLFGTVLGIIKAFHDLSQQSTGAQVVSAGISEALVATAVGLLVAIPAVVAFNFFQRRVKASLTEAEALKSFLIAKLAGKSAK